MSKLSPLEPIHIGQNHIHYPPALRLYFADRAPVAITVRGNLEIFSGRRDTPILALFCSVQCPDSIILQTYELAHALCDAEVRVISGFHSPMEKECLTVLLRGDLSVIVCPARSIERMRLPKDWKNTLRQGRLLLLSPFAEKHGHVTPKRALMRNECVAALADILLVAYAAPGGKLERLCRDLRGKRLLTLENGENAHLFALGAKAIQPDDIRRGEIFSVGEK